MQSTILHILNGDAIHPSFHEHFSDQRYIVWREALCQGPLSYAIPDEQFKADRIQFLEEGLEAKIKSHLFDELNELDLSDITEIVLWFEYDLFCQTNLMAAVSWVYQQNYEKDIFILDLEKYQQGGFIGLGQISTSAYPTIFSGRIKLEQKEIAYIDMMWSKISSKDYQLLTHIQNHTNLTRFNDAIRTAAVYSNANGLGAALVESRIYSALKHEGLTKHKLIGAILKTSADLGYGDTQVSYIIDKLLATDILIYKDELIYKT